MIRLLILAALALVPATAMAQNTAEGRADKPQQGSSPTPKDANDAADTSQRGSRGTTAGGSERTGAPTAGIESGDANGLAGGRTDEGPRGGTGIRGTHDLRHERARARASSQARRRNAKGSTARPADSPPQINHDPRAMGSGAPMTPVAEEPQAQGKNYPAGPQHGAAGGVASGTDEGSPAGAAPRGPAGKGAQTTPDNKPTTGGGNHHDENAPK